jgi:hypothetical protein
VDKIKTKETKVNNSSGEQLGKRTLRMNIRGPY